jgi:hypothetical protein
VARCSRGLMTAMTRTIQVAVDKPLDTLFFQMNRVYCKQMLVCELLQSVSHVSVVLANCLCSIAAIWIHTALCYCTIIVH